jgi:hypothetical protein
MYYFFLISHSCSKIHSPWLEYIFDSGIGLSYRPASLCSLAGRYDNPVPELTLSPQSGTMNLSTGFFADFTVQLCRRQCHSKIANPQSSVQKDLRLDLEFFSLACKYKIRVTDSKTRIFWDLYTVQHPKKLGTRLIRMSALLKSSQIPCYRNDLDYWMAQIQIEESRVRLWKGDPALFWPSHVHESGAFFAIFGEFSPIFHPSQMLLESKQGLIWSCAIVCQYWVFSTS